MKIRAADQSDLALLSRLCVPVQQMHADAHPDIFKPPTEVDFAVSFFEMIMLKPNFQIFIAENEGEAVGYIVLQEIHREGHTFTFQRDYLHIDQISVKPEHQGKGVGKALMARAVQIAKEVGLSQITLGSWMFNQTAHRFFESQGYETFTLNMWKKV